MAVREPSAEIAGISFAYMSFALVWSLLMTSLTYLTNAEQCVGSARVSAPYLLSQCHDLEAVYMSLVSSALGAELTIKQLLQATCAWPLSLKVILTVGRGLWHGYSSSATQGVLWRVGRLVE